MKPQPLQEWYMENKPADKMIYKQAMVNQFLFVRDTLPRVLNRAGIKIHALNVISTHTSKSITLPVYCFELGGTKLIMRGNFHDWKISTVTTFPITESIKDVHFNPDEKINSAYCEGFKSEWVFGTYAENNKKFTVELLNKYDVYCFFQILSRLIK